jgi:hypothetical protein
MKALHIICFWLSLSLGLLILIQIPIIQFNTPSAVKVVEERYVRQDLRDQEAAQYQSVKGRLLWNDAQLHARLTSAKYLGLGACLVLLIQSVIGLRHENRRTSTKPTATPSGDASTPRDNPTP